MRRSELVAAEQRKGWLSECADAGRFLAPSRQLVDALATVFRSIGATGHLLEICAGGGEPAEALVSYNVPVVATDAEPPPGSSVLRMSARQALRRYRPAVVLGCFLPIDSGAAEHLEPFETFTG